MAIYDENLAAQFESGQNSEDLPAEFFAKQGSEDLLGYFKGVWCYRVDLLANIYIRPEGSTVTDFQIKDLMRGLTIHDPDRIMTVTPQRRMRVK